MRVPPRIDGDEITVRVVRHQQVTVHRCRTNSLIQANLSVVHPAAVDAQDLAGDEGGVVAGEEEEGAGKVLCGATAP